MAGVVRWGTLRSALRRQLNAAALFALTHAEGWHFGVPGEARQLSVKVNDAASGSHEECVFHLSTCNCATRVSQFEESPCARFVFALCSTQSLRVERRSEAASPVQQRLCMPVAVSVPERFLAGSAKSPTPAVAGHGLNLSGNRRIRPFS